MVDVLRVAISAIDARVTALDSPARAHEIGALLLRLLIGTPAHAESLRLAGGLPLPDLAKARPGIPDDLASLVYELLDPDPALRLSDLKGIRARLSHLLALAAESGPPQRPLPGEGGSSPLPQPSSSFALTGGTTVPFIGRRHELARLVTLLTDGPARLITVTGPGGVGKSRLAMETALRLQSSFRDGVRSIPLVTLARPAFLGFAVARWLDISLSASGDPAVQILEFLKHRPDCSYSPPRWIRIILIIINASACIICYSLTRLVPYGRIFHPAESAREITSLFGGNTRDYVTMLSPVNYAGAMTTGSA